MQPLTLVQLSVSSTESYSLLSLKGKRLALCRKRSALSLYISFSRDVQKINACIILEPILSQRPWFHIKALPI